MKTCVRIILLLLIPAISFGQQGLPDSVWLALQNAPSDSVRYQRCMQLGYYYFQLNRDSGIYYCDSGPANLEIYFTFIY
jgi:hypothetical protein